MQKTHVHYSRIKVFIGEKTNEIPTAQELLPLMDLKGSIVTADAMNCQKETGRIAAGGRLLVQRKGTMGKPEVVWNDEKESHRK